MTQRYYVSRLAGPRVAGKRAAKGDELQLSDGQARSELLSGAIVADPALVDDPWGDVAQAAAVGSQTVAEHA